MIEPDYQREGVSLYCGDCRDVLAALPEASVQCCVTSPPYWQQRKYEGVEPVAWADRSECCLGLEPTPEQFVSHIVECFRAVRRVLRPDGCLWVNVGSSYDGDGNDLGMPWRVAFALQADGWRLRSAVVWAKGVSFRSEWSGSVMPESINGTRWTRCRVKVANGTRNQQGNRARQLSDAPTEHGAVSNAPQAQWRDCPGCPKCEATGGYILRRGSWRPTSAYEMVFMFTGPGAYFCDAERVKEMSVTDDDRKPYAPGQVDARGNGHDRNGGAHVRIPGQRNPRNVWAIGTSGTDRAHYASYPEALIEPMVRASTSRQACGVCGAAWAPLVENGNADMAHRRACDCDDFNEQHNGGRCVVLDCFSGTGTSGVVAIREGCDYIGIDASAEYTVMARQRLEAAATGLSEAEVEAGQVALFAGGDGA